MLRWLTLSLWVAVGFAQNPEDLFNKPPADVDQALRARITEFFQDHVDGKFRAAEALVADDTKDFYFAGNKPKYLSFEIGPITYSEGFTRARALITCEQYVMVPGFTDKPLKTPLPSTWKLVDGKWYWYVDQDAARITPFGKMGSSQSKSGGGPAPQMPTAAELNAMVTRLGTQLKADKQSVNLPAGGSDQLTLTNTAPGPLSITLLGAVHGVDVKLDRMDLKAGEKAVMTLRAGNDAKPGILSVRVDQTNQVIPIQVTIQ